MVRMIFVPEVMYDILRPKLLGCIMSTSWAPILFPINISPNTQVHSPRICRVDRWALLATNRVNTHYKLSANLRLGLSISVGAYLHNLPKVVLKSWRRTSTAENPVGPFHWDVCILTRQKPGLDHRCCETATRDPIQIYLPSKPGSALPNLRPWIPSWRHQFLPNMLCSCPGLPRSVGGQATGTQFAGGDQLFVWQTRIHAFIHTYTIV
ncbi:hypothetical protein GGR54DRAFT_8328 [Hypoxylon sp. NC1633]|nr:hypothetical protein GGR54DRAFT_8328 [Hypoxylon sp. NC1633]